MNRFPPLLTATLLAAGPACANLLVNGSFENTAGTFVENAGTTGLMRLQFGPIDDLPGWRVRWPGQDVAWARDDNPYGPTASDGSFHIDLTGLTDGPNYNGVVTAFDSTVGASYRLSFDVGVRNGPCGGVDCSGPVGVLLTIVGVPTPLFDNIDPGGAGNVWTSFSFDFTAVDTRTSIAFDGARGSAYIGLDNVSVTAVPEPAGWGLMLAGLGAVAGALPFRRRHSRQPSRPPSTTA